MHIIDHFITAIRNAADYNPDVQTAPHCILWTDHDRQWEVVIPRLQQAIPELFILGDYDPDVRQGPAIWLRCVLARTLDNIHLPNDVVPILYLPGVSRQDLRAVDSCPDSLKPLAELQYRGIIWSQVNAKDWTVLAFLQSRQGGLGLDVAQDKETKTAIQLALPKLIEVDETRFRSKRLDKDDFYQLISQDPPGELLKWLDEGEKYRQRKSAEEWRAFIELCRYHFAFNPETDGILSGAEKLANHNGIWDAIWERYQEAANRYRNIPERIRACPPPSNTLDWFDPSSNLYYGWPQWTDYQEEKLINELKSVVDQPLAEAQNMVINLDLRHGHRRDMVWTGLGMAPIVQALHHLSTLAEVTRNVTLDGGDIEDLVGGYQTSGWRADDASIRALACVRKLDDQQVVQGVIQTIYTPWAMASARHLQMLVEERGYPGGSIHTAPKPSYSNGTCVLFIDGLRFDIARRLVNQLEQHHFDVDENVCWAALPSVTATGKPAVSPVRDQITGREASVDFEPETSVSKKPVNHYHFTKLLEEAGWQIIEGTNTGDSSGKAWSEIGIIDDAGHKGNLGQRLDSILVDICDNVHRLLDAGWQRIEIVTDHGWLFLLDGLPKISLPQAFTDNQWGRCAALKPGVSTPDRLFAWFWNPVHHFALADGINCFRKGISYAHGGLSLQECLTVHLTVTKSDQQSTQTSIFISDIDWHGMRCIVSVDGASGEILVDLRLEAGNPNSSVAFSVKELKSDGTASLVVENEELIGSTVTAILMTKNEELLAQRLTVIGGENE